MTWFHPTLQKLIFFGFLAFACLSLSACGPAEPIEEAPAPNMRRLTEEQYRNIVADVFGKQITVSGRFDPLVRTEGLLAVSAWSTSVSTAGIMQYEEIAQSIAAQVLSKENREIYTSCNGGIYTEFDEPCARKFLAKVGRLLLRRPLTDNELSGKTAIAREATAKLGKFYDGLSFGLISLLVDPEFLFITDFTESDPERPNSVRLTAFSKAARLSFLLWNTTPDDKLLRAAESGDLHTRDGLNREVNRLIVSVRLKTGIRAFFSDMLGFREFDNLGKDSLIYPTFGTAVMRDAKEQTLRTITDHLVTRSGDYRDLFTTKRTFMSRPLGIVYRTRVKAPENVWEPYEFAPDDRRVGIQGQLAFLALNSHPGRSSPTLRGKAIRSMLLCQKVPDPPVDVDFSGFNNPNSPARTARERLLVHATNPSCVSCHRIIDPIGLALENFDGAGQFRNTENDAVIVSSGELDGIEFSNGTGLGQALHDNPAITTCLVNRLYAYASGRAFPANNAWLAYLNKRFTASNYRVTDLLKHIATSRIFYAVSTPENNLQQPFESAQNTVTFD